ncbi:MAG TPA: glycoside hydrolase family 32 protein [Mobilitalea sp.]|nr:glycoside hydrolase family 32 protein [Mobilitalea sp.]
MKSLFIDADKKYLLLPIADEGGWFLPADKTQYLDIYENGVCVEEYELFLSRTPRCWSCLYLERYAGEKLEIRLEGGEEDLIDLLEVSDELKDHDTLYLEPERPFVHFTPMHGYMNDPNGLLYYCGTYHYFAQLNPYGFGMGNTHWMHAVSQDLLHWRELPYALFPDESGRMYSGGGVVDTENTSGMQCGRHSPIFLFYTAAGCKSRWSKGRYFEIAAAISTDGGKSFRKYDNNPLLSHISFLNRDPKVIWNPVEKEWIMMIYLESNRYHFFYSRNLLSWEPGQIVQADGCAECPDLFFVELDGNPQNTKLVLWFCTDSYRIGHLEGRKFVPEIDLIEGPSHQIFSAFSALARSTGGYAAQTFTGLPYGHTVQVSWLRMNTNQAPFVGCASIPNELQLITTEDGPRLTVFPIKEIKNMYKESFSFAGKGLEELERIPDCYLSESMDMTFRFTVKPDKLIAISVRGILMVYDPATGRLILPTGAFSVKTQKNLLELRVITDRCSMELYVSNGRFNTSINRMLDPENTSVRPVLVDPGTGIDFEVHKLASMWEDNENNR